MGVRAVPGRGTEGGGAGPDLAHRQPALDAGAGRARAACSRWARALPPLARWPQRALALQQEGFTVSAVAGPTPQGLRVLALLAFGDEPKPGAREALAALKARGIRTVMISATTGARPRPWPGAWGWTPLRAR